MTDCKGYAAGFNGRAMATPCQRKAGPSGYCAIHSPEGEAKRRAKAEERDNIRTIANRIKFARERAMRAILSNAIDGTPDAAEAVALLQAIPTEERAALIRSVRIA